MTRPKERHLEPAQIVAVVANESFDREVQLADQHPVVELVGDGISRMISCTSARSS